MTESKQHELTTAVQTTQAHYGELHVLFEDIQAGVTNHTLEELADILVDIRDLAKFADSMRKEGEALQKLVAKIFCARFINERAAEDTNVKGTKGTVTPDIKQSASLPKMSTDPERYAEMMDYFGVPEEQRTLFRIHWPSFNVWLTKLIKQGLPAPPFIDEEKLYPVYDVRIRKTRTSNTI